MHKLVSQWTCRTPYGIEKDDLLGVAHATFMRCVRNYRPEKGPFSTWLYRNLHNDLKRYVITARKHAKRQEPFVEDINEDDDVVQKPSACTTLPPYASMLFWEKVKLLSKEAQALVDIAFGSNPRARATFAYVLGLCREERPVTFVSWLRHHMRHERGWTVAQVQKGFAELLEFVRTGEVPNEHE